MFELFFFWFAGTFIFAFIISIFVFFNTNTDFNGSKQILVSMFNPKINMFTLESIIMWTFRWIFFGSILIIVSITQIVIFSHKPISKRDKSSRNNKGKVGISDKLINISEI